MKNKTNAEQRLPPNFFNIAQLYMKKHSELFKKLKQDGD